LVNARRTEDAFLLTDQQVGTAVQLALNERQREFFDEVSSFFESTPIRALTQQLQTASQPDPRELYHRLGEQRLLAPSWPEQFGGRGLGQVEACLLLEALGASGCTDTLYITSIQVVGNIVLEHGSEQLKNELLGGLASGSRFASVLYSEYEAGSDLAGLATVGVQGETDWVISGRKTWTAQTAYATDALIAFRSDGQFATRYDGLSLAMIAMDQPGIRIVPTPTLSDEVLNVVHLHNVHAPVESTLGPPGRAWPILMGSISYERTGFDYLARAQRWLRLCHPLRELAGVRRLDERFKAARFLAYLTAEAVDIYGRHDGQAALIKLICSQIAQEIAYLLAECGGALPSDELWRAIREAPGLTISAGSSEVLIDLIAANLPDNALGWGN
jgi:alkylation response protein AidB-like acyl-CoA dehydrogenase